MSFLNRGRLRRVRRVGIRLLAGKFRIRIWSNRVAIIVARSTEASVTASTSLPLSFSIVASGDVDPNEILTETLRGADLLYVDSMLRLFKQEPGDAIVVRTSDDRLVAVGLMSYADRHEALERAAPSLYHRLAPDECWTEAHYVVPQYRKMKILGATLAAERTYLYEQGYRRVLAVIDVANTPSLRAFSREGYQPTGVIRRDTYRLNRLTTRFSPSDDETDNRWRGATSPRRD